VLGGGIGAFRCAALNHIHHQTNPLFRLASDGDLEKRTGVWGSGIRNANPYYSPMAEIRGDTCADDMRSVGGRLEIEQGGGGWNGGAEELLTSMSKGESYWVQKVTPEW
jgi:hypothetical protein